MFRLSTNNDKEQIRELIEICQWQSTGVTNLDRDINGLFYLYFDKDELLGLSKISYSPAFKCQEIECILVKECDKCLGIIEDFIHRFEEITDEDFVAVSPLFGIYNKDYLNKAVDLIKDLGFVEDESGMYYEWKREKEIRVRFSNKDDKAAIKNMVESCFGKRNFTGYLNNLDNRYLLFIRGGQPVGMSGIEWDDEYEEFVIARTCTLMEHRNLGIQHVLFQHIIDNFGNKILCDCWRTNKEEPPYLIEIMNEFGFTLVEEASRSYGCKGKEECKWGTDKCVYSTNNELCYCQTDLYIRNEVPNVLTR